MGKGKLCPDDRSPVGKGDLCPNYCLFCWCLFVSPKRIHDFPTGELKPIGGSSPSVNLDNRIAIPTPTKTLARSHRPSVEAMNKHREPSHPMSVEARRDSFPGSWRSEENPLGRLHAWEWTINTGHEKRAVKLLKQSQQRRCSEKASINTKGT